MSHHVDSTGSEAVVTEPLTIAVVGARRRFVLTSNTVALRPSVRKSTVMSEPVVICA
jgi:hypothetical protein